MYVQNKYRICNIHYVCTCNKQCEILYLSVSMIRTLGEPVSSKNPKETASPSGFRSWAAPFLYQRGPELLRVMADSRWELQKEQNDPGTFCD